MGTSRSDSVFSRGTWFYSRTNDTSGAVSIKLVWTDASESIRYESAHLTLYSVKYDHQGYYFFMTFGRIPTVFCNQYLNVLSKPGATCKPLVEAKEGEQVNLTCDASGNPKPSVWWSRHIPEQGTKLVKILDGKSLTIFDIQRYHNGDYVCTAKNTEGERSCSTRVNITFMPDVEVYEERVEVTWGQKVTLVCRVTANPMPTTIWTIRGRNDKIRSDLWHIVTEDDEMLTSYLTRYMLLTIKKVEYTEDYTCRPLGYGWEYYRNVTVTVKDRP